MTLILPERVAMCSHCEGHGNLWHKGNYDGNCSLCRGARFVFHSTGKPAPKSVQQQIATTNNITFVQINLHPNDVVQFGSIKP